MMDARDQVIARQILREGEEMATRLLEHLPAITQASLQAMARS